MNRFASGLIAGGMLGVAGAALAMSDKKSRKRMMRDGRRVMKKASDMVDNVTDIF